MAIEASLTAEYSADVSIPFTPTSSYKKGDEVKTPVLWAGHFPFYIAVYPRGSEATAASKALSVYLAVAVRDDWCDSWEFAGIGISISAKQTAGEANARRLSRDFNAKKHQWAGFPFFVACDGYAGLKKNSFIFPDDTVRFNVKITGDALQRPVKRKRCPDNCTSLYQQMLFPDMRIRAGEVEADLPCHRAVLASASSVISRMLASDMVEGREKLITVRGSSTSALRSLLAFVYTGDLPEEAMANLGLLKDLMGLADQYDVTGLFPLCVRRVSELMSPESACDVVRVLAAYPDNPVASAALAQARAAVRRNDAMFESLWKNLIDGGSDK